MRARIQKTTLARGPRHQLPAEFIRDQALAVSGLLNDHRRPQRVAISAARHLGGIGLAGTEELDRPGIHSEPRGGFVSPHHVHVLETDRPPPSLATFDAPDRETCVVRRARTNTPLQALVLMNDPTYVEASRKLAERMLTEGGTTRKIAWPFVPLATGARREIENWRC